MYVNILFNHKSYPTVEIPWTAAHPVSLFFTVFWSLFKLMSIESLMTSNHLIFCHTLLLLLSFPASGSFPISWLFAYMNIYSLYVSSLEVQRVKHLPEMQETWVWSLGWEDSLEKEMATDSSTLAWRIPWMEEHGRLQSMGSQRVRDKGATSLSLSLYTGHTHTHIYIYITFGKCSVLFIKKQ